MNRSTPGLPVHHNSRSLLKLMSNESVMPSSHLILCRRLLLLPTIPPSIRVFSSESTLHMRWPKYWSFSISPSKEHPGLLSFRMDWLDLLAVQGILKSLLQHQNSKASIHQCFSSVQISHSIVSNYLPPHESQHARPPCPSQLPEFTQTHVHQVSDAIQPSHLLSSPSPPALSPSQHQSLFQ